MRPRPLLRLMGFVLVATVVLFLIAAIAGNHHHGVRGFLGDVGWWGFLLGVLALIVLAILFLVARLRERPTTA
jgi:uncharacterized membrane protein YdjX (TVP38/TMEM64 family)